MEPHMNMFNLSDGVFWAVYATAAVITVVGCGLIRWHAGTVTVADVIVTSALALVPPANVGAALVVIVGSVVFGLYKVLKLNRIRLNRVLWERVEEKA
jgi:phosphotransferase system  glucose/maltose/N-acetylglucosamine-specific IIC component